MPWFHGFQSKSRLCTKWWINENYTESATSQIGVIKHKASQELKNYICFWFSVWCTGSTASSDHRKNDFTANHPYCKWKPTVVNRLTSRLVGLEYTNSYPSTPRPLSQLVASVGRDYLPEYDGNYCSTNEQIKRVRLKMLTSPWSHFQQPNSFARESAISHPDTSLGLLCDPLSNPFCPVSVCCFNPNWPYQTETNTNKQMWKANN